MGVLSVVLIKMNVQATKVQVKQASTTERGVDS